MKRTTRSSVSCLMVSCFLLLFAAQVPARAADNPFEVPEKGSASHSEGPFGQTINPVFADLQSTPMLAYQFALYDGKKSGDHFVQAGMYGFTFLYGWFQDIYLKNIDNIDHAGASYFSFTKGFMIKNIVGFGVSYSFSESRVRSFKGYNGLNVGFLLRPCRWVSLGFVMDDAWGIINGNRIRWREIYSLSVRPYWERATLSLDIIREKGEKASRLNYKVTADFRIWYDIALFISGDRHLDLLFGVTVPFAFHSFPGAGFALHYYRTGNRAPGPDRNSAGISFPMARSGSALPLPGLSSYLKIVIDGHMKEAGKRSFFGREAVVFYDIVRAIDRAAEDTALDGIILVINRADLGFAQVQELRQGLKKARYEGKKVYAIMTDAGNKEYYLASAADRIYFTPNTPFTLTGLKAQVYFFKGLMDKIGAEFESVKHGTYKSFNEAFTREHMSDAARENITALLEDLNRQYVEDISADRGISRETMDDIFGRGFLTPENAVKARFIDKTGYPDDALDDIGRGSSIVGLSTYLKSRDRDYAWGPVPRIAIVTVEGSIVSGEAFDSGWLNSIGDETYRAALEKAFSDISVRAVVIRVDSGGGSAAASDYMWNSLVKLGKKYRKPVVFSFGNVAASGGYYIACTGDKIFTDRGSITGSIGVVFGKITLEELYRKLGINKDVIRMSEFADIFSESRHLTQKEKNLLQEGIDFTYDRFTGRVMEARKIATGEVARIAEGRVFTGLQAKDKGLTDETGGIIAAVQYACHLAKIGDRFEVVKYPDERGALIQLFKLPLIDALGRELRGLIRNAEYLRLKDEKALYLNPYHIEVE